MCERKAKKDAPAVMVSCAACVSRAPPADASRPALFVCGACIGTAQVGVSLVSFLNPLFKQFGLHCLDIRLT